GGGGGCTIFSGVLLHPSTHGAATAVASRAAVNTPRAVSFGMTFSLDTFVVARLAGENRAVDPVRLVPLQNNRGRGGTRPRHKELVGELPRQDSNLRPAG